MRRVTISTANVVPPVLAPAEVISLLSSRMTGQARLRDLFRWFIFERDNLCRITLLHVRLSWAMTGFAPRRLSFPTADLR